MYKFIGNIKCDINDYEQAKYKECLVLGLLKTHIIQVKRIKLDIRASTN